MNVANTPALLLTALLGLGTLSACQENTTATSSATTSETSTTASESSASSAATDASAAATEDASGTATASGAAASAAEVSEPGEVPAGYTALEPLSGEPVRAFEKLPAAALQEGTDYYALLDTSRGQILIDLLEKDVPVTVNNFV
ncbi:MAG: peptidylprolyl isomerase, partial [Deinococcus sp.]|nr:peptidylprolyl isomerase [Deinococcus sp.]